MASSLTEVQSDVTRPEMSGADAQRGTENDGADIEMSEIHLRAVPESETSAHDAGTDAGDNFFPYWHLSAITREKFARVCHSSGCC